MNERERAEIAVTEISAELTHDLRLRVLRNGTPTASVVWAGDDLDTTVHLGSFHVDPATGERAGSPIAISTWLDQISPDVDAPVGLNHPVGVQLRGMATDPTVRGHGHGAHMLRAGVDRARRSGVDHVWANARSNVLGFYVSNGFAIVSDEFESTETAIPHRRILLRFDD